MIIVKKPGHLIFKNFKFRCSLGKNGISDKKKEGDGITPRGTFKLTKLFYREDKIKNIRSKIKKGKIKKNMGWCDDSKSHLYNQQIKLPNKYSHEKLFRNDNLYDLILVLNYNINPTIKHKGSAIFIHITKNSYKKTKGCIALKKENLIELISKIKKNTKIKIN